MPSGDFTAKTVAAAGQVKMDGLQIRQHRADVNVLFLVHVLLIILRLSSCTPGAPCFWTGARLAGKPFVVAILLPR